MSKKASNDQVPATMEDNQGEYIAAGESTDKEVLEHLTEDFVAAIRSAEDTVWELGRVLSEGAAICEDKTRAEAAGLVVEGAEGGTAKKRLGQWVELNLRAAGVDFDRTTLFRYRKIWENLSAYRDQISGLSTSVLMELANGTADLANGKMQKLVKQAVNGGDFATVVQVRNYVRVARGIVVEQQGPSETALRAIGLANKSKKALTESANSVLSNYSDQNLTQKNHIENLVAMIGKVDRMTMEDVQRIIEVGQAAQLIMEAISSSAED
jgi:hypothetical protein